MSVSCLWAKQQAFHDVCACSLLDMICVDFGLEYDAMTPFGNSHHLFVSRCTRW
jgi:hypothetical protein